MTVCIVLFYKIIVELKACVQASFPVPQLAVNVHMPWIICLYSDTCGHTAHYTCQCKEWQRRSARFSNSTRAGHYSQLWLFIAAVALLVKNNNTVRVIGKKLNKHCFAARLCLSPYSLLLIVATAAISSKACVCLVWREVRCANLSPHILLYK